MGAFFCGRRRREGGAKNLVEVEEEVRTSELEKGRLSSLLLHSPPSLPPPPHSLKSESKPKVGKKEREDEESGVPWSCHCERASESERERECAQNRTDRTDKTD